MARVALRPKRDHGLERRAPGQAADNFADQDRGVFGKLEARARPFPHPVEGFQLFGTLGEGAQHVGYPSAASVFGPTASLSPHQKHLPPRLSIGGIRAACGIKIALTG
jgi:hypothetical protein